MGIDISIPSALISGKIFFNFLAAVTALGNPPLVESSKSYRDYLTGFE